MESLEVFKLVTKDDRCITVAKMNTVFTLQVHGCTVTLFGNNLRVRSFHRTVGKFKAVRTVEL